VILAGDIGGTKALLLFAALRQGRVEPVLDRCYRVASFPGFYPAFDAKGAHAQMNLTLPVRVVTTERLGLPGAALIAARI
jgi:glucokinase